MTTWDLRGTSHQVSIVEAALAKCDFPWKVLTTPAPIEVEWADLSVFETRVIREHVYDPLAHALVGEVPDHGYDIAHDHQGEWDPMVREIDGRMRILGLAWYSGKVSLDLYLEDDLLLAQEVFLSEAAHMIDFFWMDDLMRTFLWNQAHRDLPIAQIPENADVQDGEILDPDHPEHGWFDVGGYYGWVGEWWMGAFVMAFAPSVPVTIVFDHPLDTQHAIAIRTHVQQKLLEEGGPTLPPGTTPPRDGCLPKFFRSWLR